MEIKQFSEIVGLIAALWGVGFTFFNFIAYRDIVKESKSLELEKLRLEVMNLKAKQSESMSELNFESNQEVPSLTTEESENLQSSKVSKTKLALSEIYTGLLYVVSGVCLIFTFIAFDLEDRSWETIIIFGIITSALFAKAFGTHKKVKDMRQARRNQKKLDSLEELNRAMAS